MGFLRNLILILLCVTLSRTANFYYTFESADENDFEEYGNEMESLSDNFTKLEAKPVDDQESVFNDAKNKIRKYKDNRDYNLSILQERINNIKNQISKNMTDLEDKRSNIEVLQQSKTKLMIKMLMLKKI